METRDIIIAIFDDLFNLLNNPLVFSFLLLLFVISGLRTILSCFKQRYSRGSINHDTDLDNSIDKYDDNRG